MGKEYNYKNYFSISEAMRIHNNIMPGKKFTLLDYNILCLVKSFHDAQRDFYMSNDQIANALLSCERTVRSSIDRLCAAGFLQKEYIDGNRLKGRYLRYQHDAVQSLLFNMKNEISR